MRRQALLVSLGLCLTLLFMGGAADLYGIPFARKLERIIYDTKLRLFMPGRVDERIIILDIDEKSLKEEGRWPWRRDRLGLLMDKLFDRQGVAVVGFDVVFPEKDESSGLKILQDLGRSQFRGVPQYHAVLEKLRPQLEYDQILADKIKGRQVVLGYYFTAGTVTGALPPPVLPAGSFRDQAIFMRPDGYGGNLPELQASAASGGHFNPVLDEDGLVRRVPVLVEFRGAYYESLGLAVSRALLGNPSLVPAYAGRNDSPDWLELQGGQGKLRIPMDLNVNEYGARELSTLVAYRGPAGSFPYVSVTDILHDRLPDGALKGKVVLIGTSAPGLQDLRATPVGAAYPGVEVHANLIASILDQDFKRRPANPYVVEALMLLVLGVSLSLLLPRISPVLVGLVSGVVFVGLAGLDATLWQRSGIDLPLAHGLMLVATLFLLNMSLGYLIEARRKHQITMLFGQYVPAELVEEMSKRPEEVSMETESREMTILFSDIRGFTSISERLEPKELSQMMNEFLTVFTRVIHGRRGTIDKYMGDCIMAFWGAPLYSKDHARDAVLTGMEMFRALRELQQKFKERGWPELRMGVGINTGRVNVGNMGSEVRVAYTVMGDAVNLASRLESITKQYQVDFIVGESTRAAAPGVVYRELDLVRVKGKDRPVAIYEPIGLEGEVGSDLMEEIGLYQQALQMYRNRQWDQAELQLRNLQLRSQQDRLYQVFLDRIAHFRNNPPPENWGGVFDWEIK